MTKRVYKTAAELSITEGERKVLMLARNWLRTSRFGELCKVPSDGMFKFEMQLTRRLVEDPVTQKVCGSAGCIWGLCYVIAKAKGIKAFDVDPMRKNAARTQDYNVSEALDRLFFPHRYESTVAYSNMSSQIAGNAVDGFLKTGKVDFHRAD